MRALIVSTGLLVSASTALGGPTVEQQHLAVSLRPAEHEASIVSRLRVLGAGELELRLTRGARITRVRANGAVRPFERTEVGDEPDLTTVIVESPAARSEIIIEYDATFLDDVASGERPGQIHNKAVDAHVGPGGVFLADGAAWHPRPIGEDGHPMLHVIAVDLEELEDWALVASGDPTGGGDVDEPVWSWCTPRPVDGLAVAGGPHRLFGRRHETPEGDVEVVMHVRPDNERFVSMFLDAACAYLDTYVPLVGAYPYRRFTIVQNFFSSGFAFPGFTLLGPRVIAMAPRSLAPGYLDHELLHSWWGNGVYVDPDDGNWCEGLTAFCTNYYRRVIEDGDDAGRVHRRGILMRLSSDPGGLDDGPLGEFGRPDGPGRFVGYDKGTFFFVMLSRLAASSAGADPGEGPWPALRRFAAANLGRRAGWAEIQAAFEAADPDGEPGWLDGAFRLWVREHTVPHTVPGDPRDAREQFAAQFAAGGHEIEVVEDDRAVFEIDPDFVLYRVLPPEQIIPTIGGTTGAGGVAISTDDARPELATLRQQVEPDDSGENLLVVGLAAVREHEGLIGRAADAIEVDDGRFTVGGVTYEDPDAAVLHTMQHPDRPGRFITVFHSNGEAGWSRLRLILFYSRDTTVVWTGDRVTARRTFEPDRRITAGQG